MTAIAAKSRHFERATALFGKLAGGTGAAHAEAFVTGYFGRMAAEDVMGLSAETLAAMAHCHFRLMRRRPPGKTLVAVYNPALDRDGWDAPRTVVDVVVDDMPFLVDSVTAGVGRAGHQIHLIAHPVLHVRRDRKGGWLGLDRPGSGTRPESVMHVELTTRLGAEDMAALQARIEKVLGDVRVAVADWKALTLRLEQTVGGIDAMPPPLDAAEIAEAKAFLRWMIDNHFTFLGARDYDYIVKGGKERMVPVAASGLGLLRDPAAHILTSAQGATDLPPLVRDFLRQPRLLIIAKANVRATVHRDAYMDYIGVKRFDGAGRVIGERRFVGLFTSAAYNLSPREIPLLRRKVAVTLERAGFGPSSHDGKALVNIVETYPRDELFQVAEDELFDTALGILRLQERPRVRLFARRDKFERFVSCLVFTPRESFDTALRHRFERILAEAWKGRNSAYYTQLGDGPLARIHFIVGTTPGAMPRPDLAAIEAKLAAAARSWDELLLDAAVARHGHDAAAALSRRFAGAFPAAYRDAVGAEAALHDIAKLMPLAAAGAIALDLYRRPGDDAATLRLKIYHVGGAIPLSDALPVLENMGLRVLDEIPHHIAPPAGAEATIQELHLVERHGRAVDLAALKSKFEDAFLAVWRSRADNDALNSLVLRAGLGWREITILRSFTRYLRQVGIAFSNQYMMQALTANPAVTRALTTLFHARFDPKAAKEREPARQKALRQAIAQALDAVANLDEDRILRRYLNLIESALRTNYYQPGADGQPKAYLSIKYDSRKLDDLPLPRPMFEVFVYSPRVEAIHLRGGKVARGGIRWSDRREDFRTEILGLIKAQMVKNAVIVPVGAKGGFVCKRMPTQGGPEAMQKEGIACYQTLVRGLLDLTDNIVKGGTIVHPQAVVRHDPDDPYLVVAADKGTATFSDIANALSKQYGFWLDDAFASGGSAGYDHKKMGITAAGAWESVKRHFRELGIDAHKTPIATVGIGDMSGDVFGNGLLMAPTLKLVGAFNHLHIFVDPAPADLKRAYEERKRMFALPRSAWTDYDARLISKGGGVFERKAKALRLSAEIKQLTGLTADEVTPTQLIQALLRAPVDLLWNGGIGTYVKASTETHLQVGDRANDGLRIDGRELRCKVVGEGGNLGFTQRGRIEAAAAGVRLNTDAIDNSGGVDCSDHEVNIKILLGAAVAEKKLDGKSRDRLLAKMTAEVGELVLQDNYLQPQAITCDARQGVRLLESHARFIRRLERAGKLDRAVEYLPDEPEIARRLAAGRGLTRPEIAVVLAYAKTTLYDDLLDSDVPEDPYLATDLFKYFPRPLRKSYARQIERHRLRREIIATFIANSMVNRAGPSFVDSLAEETGAPAGDIAKAYAIVRDAFEMRTLWTGVQDLDNRVPAEIQTDALVAAGDLVRHGTLWLLRRLPRPLDIAQQIGIFAPGLKALGDHLGQVLTEDEAKAYRSAAQNLVGRGVPESLAKRIAGMAWLAAGLDIVAVAREVKRPVIDVGRAYFSVGARLGLDWLRGAALALAPQNHWDRQAIRAAIDDVYGSQRALAAAVLKSAPAKGDHAWERWAERNRAQVERAGRLVAEFRASGEIDVAKLAIANRAVRGLTGE
ncbi:MAG: NAD-glutamate dehydrogenase [Alphaproteobacteria bacterium]|nr:NAD-glutamate dehydrogenase [Alphaproteobacteria bacterium]